MYIYTKVSTFNLADTVLDNQNQKNFIYEG